MPGKPPRSSSLWTFLCSLKLTVATLLLLAAASILGTVIPQNLSSQQYLQHYGDKAHLLQALQLDDMYHSAWFMALLGLFVLNLVACSLRRLPAVWRTVTRPPLVADGALLRSPPIRPACRQAVPLKRLSNGCSRYCGSGSPVLGRPGAEQDLCLFAERRRYARFGAYVTHLAILFIILGALVGSWFGFDSFVPVGEGETVTQVPAGKGQAPLELGFALRCDDFSVSYYEGSSRPREYRSLLTVIEDGQEVSGYTEVPVVVNRPLQYRGLTFYQSSYGLAEMPLFHLQVRMPDGSEVQVPVDRVRCCPWPTAGRCRWSIIRRLFATWAARRWSRC
ncbi:MAG: cytochrome c biogenesis protein ResB [Syntrophotaleaceae bacterium]